MSELIIEFLPEVIIDPAAESLDLNHQRLDKIEDLEPLVNIQDLCLRWNMIKKIENLSSLTTLVKLVIADNQLTELENLDALVHLEILDVSYNRIGEIKGLENLTNLKKLYLESNRIKKIENVSHLQKLTLLELGDNKIRAIENLEGLTSLSELHLGKNKITEIRNLETLQSLTLLGLMSNRIKKITGLETLAELTELYLSDNGITVIEGLENNVKLTTLDLATNKISKIENLTHLSELADLWLNSNEIKDWGDVERLSVLGKLETIYLEKNPLESDVNYRRKLKLILPQLIQIDATYCLWRYRGGRPFLYNLYRLFVIGSFIILLISELFAMVLALPDIRLFNYIMCTFSCACLVVFKALFLLPMIDRVEMLQERLNSQVDGLRMRLSGQTEYLDDAASKVQDLVRFFASGMGGTAILWACFPFLDNGGARKLPLPIWLPCDTSITPVYELAFAFELVIMGTAILALAGTDIMFCGFLVQASAHYDIIACDLKNIGEWYRFRHKKVWKDDEKLKNALRCCVQHHQIVVRIIQEIDEIFKKPCTVQFIGGTILICVAGFEVLVLATEINAHIFSRGLYLSIALADLFVYCAFGTLIIVKSENVAAAIYNMPWYTMDIKVAKTMMLIMCQARNPPKITVGRLYTLNFVTYLAMLRTAYSAFSLLRQIVN